MRPLRIGLIGASRVATYAMIEPASDRDDVEVVGVAARDPLRATAYAGEHGLATAYPDYAALIADPGIDLVYIGTPPVNHAELAIAAARAGKAVLVEKPFAMNETEAQAAAEAANANGTLMLEALHSCHHPLFASIAAEVRGGGIGRLQSVEAQFLERLERRPDDFRWSAALGGGVLLDIGVYLVAFIRGIAGADPRVTAASMTMDGEVDVDVHADFLLPGGAKASMHSSLASSEGVDRIVVTGEQGRIVCTGALLPGRGHTLLIENEEGRRFDAVPDTVTSYAAQLEAVVVAARTGKLPDLHCFDFVGSMRVLDEVRNAAGP